MKAFTGLLEIEFIYHSHALTYLFAASYCKRGYCKENKKYALSKQFEDVQIHLFKQFPH